MSAFVVFVLQRMRTIISFVIVSIHNVLWTAKVFAPSLLNSQHKDAHNSAFRLKYHTKTLGLFSLLFSTTSEDQAIERKRLKKID